MELKAEKFFVGLRHKSRMVPKFWIRVTKATVEELDIINLDKLRRTDKTLQEKDHKGYSENFDDLIADGNYIDETKGKRGVQNKEKKRTASRKANKKASKQRKKNSG